MAASPTSEASEIRRRGRQRLIGAVALVVLLVVFVPMVLDSEPRPVRELPALAIPSKSNVPALPAPVAKAPAAKAPEAKAPETKAAPEPAKVAAAKPAGAPTETAAPRLEGFAVQVGAFRDEAKLRQAREKIAAAGIAHYTERLDAQGGALTRLRAGPFASREAAELALSALRRSALEGKVVALP